MKKINALKLEALKKDYYVAFMRFVNSIVPGYEVLRERFAYFVNRFVSDYNKLDEVYLKFDIDSCTKAVQEADTERNRAFRHLKDLIGLALTYPENAAKKQAAETLMRVIEMYGGYRIPNQGQPAKSATISNLVEDFETKYPTDVEALGVGAEVRALKEAQARYDEKYLARTMCESEVVKGAMADARKALDESYRLLVDAVNLKVYEDVDGRLDEFINVMNVEVGRNRTYTGQGQVGSASGSGSDEGAETVAVKTATFNFKNGNQVKLRLEVGSVLEAPASTEGYMWRPTVPEVMPARNCTFREVAIAAEEVTATFHFFDHTEEEIKGRVGTALVAPQNTEGYYWMPTVPTVMPAEDTSYYELPVEVAEPSLVTALFQFHGERIEEIKAEVGAALTAPANTEGYRWDPAVPATMPAVNSSYSEVAASATKYTVAWYYPNGNPIVWYELYPGETIPAAPECPEGYYWHPYPTVMPEHDLDIIPEPIKG